MPHDTPLVATIVAGLVLAFVLGAVANRLRLPPTLGYLIAGIAIGPHTFGFGADVAHATTLGEFGLILLMFGVGLHFSLRDVLAVRAVALAGAVAQIAVATALGLGLALLLGWPTGAGFMLGLALSVASSFVLLRALQDRRLIDSARGHIAIGWLIVEDIAVILALVLIPPLATLLGGAAPDLHDPFIDLIERLVGIQLNIWGIIAVTAVKIAAFAGFMLVVGRRVIPWALHLTAHSGNRELFRLAVLAIALGIAGGSAYLFGVSLAVGAFFAGLILSESGLAKRAARETLPLREAFPVLFFIAVGMLFNPAIIVQNPLPLLAAVFIIIVGKSAAGFLVCLVFRQPAGTALTVSAGLAQIGEFSFILATLGVGLGILPPEGRDLIVAGVLVSIILNPLIFKIFDAARPRLEARQAVRNPAIVVPNRVEPVVAGAAAPQMPQSIAAPEGDERRPTARAGHTVLVGYGRVGQVVADGLKRAGTPFVVIEDTEESVAAAQGAGFEVIAGNAATPETLHLANVAGAATLIVAIPAVFEAGQVVAQSRKLNATLMIVARAHSDEEVTYLRGLGANEAIMGEREIGLGLLGWTNGENAHQQHTERVQAGFEAVAAALQVDPLPEGSSASSGPAVPVDELEASIERALLPAHKPEGPAEPPLLVPALGEMPAEPQEIVQEDLPPDEELPLAARSEPVTIDIEPRHVVPEPEAPALPPEPRSPRAGAPASMPGVPFRPDLSD